MNLSAQDISDMENLIVGQLKMASINNNYPKDEVILTKILVLIKEQRITCLP